MLFKQAVTKMVTKLGPLTKLYSGKDSVEKTVVFLETVEACLRTLSMDLIEFKRCLEQEQGKFTQANELLNSFSELFGDVYAPLAYLDSERSVSSCRLLTVSHIFNCAQYQGRAESHYYVAICLTYGIWVPKDQGSADYFLYCAAFTGYADALILLENLARRDDLVAQLQLAYIDFDTAVQTNGDRTLSEGMLKVVARGAKTSSATVQYRCGLCSLRAQDLNNAAYFLLLAARQGYVSALSELVQLTVNYLQRVGALQELQEAKCLRQLPYILVEIATDYKIDLVYIIQNVDKINGDVLYQWSLELLQYITITSSSKKFIQEYTKCANFLLDAAVNMKHTAAIFVQSYGVLKGRVINNLRGIVNLYLKAHNCEEVGDKQKAGEHYFSLGWQLLINENPNGKDFLEKSAKLDYHQAKFILEYICSSTYGKTCGKKVSLRLQKYVEMREFMRTGNVERQKKSAYELAQTFTITQNTSVNCADFLLRECFLRFSLYGISPKKRPKDIAEKLDELVQYKVSLQNKVLSQCDNLTKAVIYLEDDKVKKNNGKVAFQLLYDEIQKGDACAKYFLAKYYWDGIGVNASEGIAFQLLADAFSLDSNPCSHTDPNIKAKIQIIMGRYDLLCAKYEEAIQLFLSAAIGMMYSEAQFWLGYCSFYGYGRKRDTQLAIEYFYRAAIGNCTFAYHHLVAFYLLRCNAADDDEARFLVEFAAAQGDIVATEWLKIAPFSLDNIIRLLPIGGESGAYIKGLQYLQLLLSDLQNPDGCHPYFEFSSVILGDGQQKLDVAGRYMLGFNALSVSILMAVACEDHGDGLEKAFQIFLNTKPKLIQNVFIRTMHLLVEYCMQGKKIGEEHCVLLAQKWLKLASWAKSNMAEDMLALCRFKGVRREELLKIWRLIKDCYNLSDKERVDAQLEVSKLFLVNRVLTKRNQEIAIRYLKNIIAQESKFKELHEICQMAKKLLSALRIANHAEKCLLDILSGKEQRASAIEQLKQAYNAGYLEALYLISAFYVGEEATPEQLEWVRKELIIQSTAGVCSAKYMLANYYLLCQPLDHDIVIEAISLFQGASAGGEFEAMVYLAVLYFFGCGVPKDTEKARCLLFEASRQKIATADSLDHLFFENSTPRQTEDVLSDMRELAKKGGGNIKNFLTMIDGIFAVVCEESKSSVASSLGGGMSFFAAQQQATAAEATQSSLSLSTL